MQYQFCASFSNKSCFFSLSNGENLLSILKEEVNRRLSVLPEFQRLIVNGKDLQHCKIDSKNVNFVEVKLRLDGGKGGFGYLLRNGSTGIRKKKTTNFKSCRNLDGRRLRDVEFMKQVEKSKEIEQDPNKIDLDDFDDIDTKPEKNQKKKKRKSIENEDYDDMLQRRKKLEEKKQKMRKELIEETNNALEEGMEKSLEIIKEESG